MPLLYPIYILLKSNKSKVWYNNLEDWGRRVLTFREVWAHSKILSQKISYKQFCDLDIMGYVQVCMALSAFESIILAQLSQPLPFTDPHIEKTEAEQRNAAQCLREKIQCPCNCV